MKWIVGDVGIINIVEQPLDELELVLPDATPQVLDSLSWLRPHYVDERGHMLGVIQAFVVDTGALRVVVDTCIGDDRDRAMVENWHHQNRNTISKFTEAGYPPDTIDFVMCTHLHVDHVGWNTYFDGSRFVPSFPNARYLFARSEYEAWVEENGKPPQQPAPDDELGMLRAAFGEMQKTVFADSIRPVLDAGLADLVEPDHRIADGLQLMPSPGHTAGHVSLRITSGDHEAVITGDAIHHPVQIGRPELGTVVDFSPELAATTRRRLLADAVDRRTLIIGSHFAEPAGGTVRRDGAGFRLCEAGPGSRAEP